MSQIRSDWPHIEQIGTFKDHFTVHFGSALLKSDRKSPGFVPFSVNLTHFVANPYIPVSYNHASEAEPGEMELCAAQIMEGDLSY